MTKAVFLDRDGVINVNCPRQHDYIKLPQEFILLPSAAAGIKKLNDAGYKVIVVTNQRGVARGMMTTQDVDAVHQEMTEQLAKQGAQIDKIYVCPHENGECNCRKPQPGLLIQAIEEFKIDAEASWMIGDHITDMQAGKAAGVKTILVGKEEPNQTSAADFICNDLLDAANLILSRSK